MRPSSQDNKKPSNYVSEWEKEETKDMEGKEGAKFPAWLYLMKNIPLNLKVIDEQDTKEVESDRKRYR